MPLCLRMQPCDYIRNTSLSCFSALFNTLLRLRAPIHAENTWNNQMCTCSLFLFFYSSTNAQTCTITHTHTRRALITQARHSCHVILLGIMPTAKHVTYQKSLRQSERARLCTFVSLWELLVKCKYSAHTGNMKFSFCSYLQCTVVWGQLILRKKKTCDLWDLMWNCSKEHAMFTVHCLNSWKASWKARSEPRQHKWVTFQDS